MAASGWRALQDADLVQGRTEPARPISGYEQSLIVDPPSWRWETANLFFRRDLFERVGGYDESWNSDGRVGQQYGEDVEWGWRAVRAGARTAAAPEAVVQHLVQARTYGQYLRYMWTRTACYPHLLRSTPELRAVFYRGYFWNRRHVRLTASAGIMAAAIAAGALRVPPVSAGLALLAAGFYVAPYRREAFKPNRRVWAQKVREEMLTEWVCFASLAASSARWRRVLL